MKIMHDGNLRSFNRLVLRGDGCGYALLRNRDSGRAQWWVVRRCAEEEAKRQGASETNSGHLLLGLFRMRVTRAAEEMQAAGITEESLYREVTKLSGRGDSGGLNNAKT